MPDLTDDEIQEAFNAWERTALLLASGASDRVVKASWDAAFYSAAGARPGYFDPEAQLFIRRYTLGAIRKITAEEREVIRRVMLDSIRDGLGVDEAARRLGAEFDVRRSRLRLIARTELNRAANYGRLQGYIASGVVKGYEWIATHDDRTRASHLAADGEIRRGDAPFKRGAASGLKAPPAAPNCRCTIAAITDFDSESLLAARKRRPTLEQEFPFLHAETSDLEEGLDRAWTDAMRRLMEAVK